MKVFRPLHTLHLESCSLVSRTLRRRNALGCGSLVLGFLNGVGGVLLRTKHQCQTSTRIHSKASCYLSRNGSVCLAQSQGVLLTDRCGLVSHEVSHAEASSVARCGYERNKLPTASASSGPLSIPYRLHLRISSNCESRNTGDDMN
ncbi:mitochondrial chaperone ATPase [Pseudozyma hubeiensis SY62]|uniref:Mitochondrial chaperone ATPase n=1 Tax=Pseudozyma hubeiensis (strain SY62) TaxID=1305764 RepID=R9NXA9_PSEHS|nr:mitochondrial chaperone ATPase [Pseudozyma hubeiensis SY62]GAC93206.1 mitochondrial chaperone ATPase [Pseudozyma hubeiensis SY62]